MTELIDQDCPTDAEHAAIFVTSLGEVLREGEYLPCSSVNLSEVARRYGNSDAVNVEREFERLQKQCLNKRERAFVQRVCALQRQITDGRWRVYGQLGEDQHDERIVLVTEFKERVDNEAFWRELAKVRARTKAHYWVMDESEEIEHSWKVDAQDQKVPGSDHYGPNHKQLMRQVELSWRIEALSAPQLKAARARWRKQTEAVWKKAGVGVC